MGLLALGALAVAPAAQAVTTATTATVSYTTPGSYSFVVPNGVSSLTVTAVGAPGGGEGGFGLPGGRGAMVTATVPVSGGEALTVGVGSAGGTGGFLSAGGPGAGGIGGGGVGGAGTFGGGGGGGASLVGVGAPSPGFGPFVVAGGGGGGGGYAAGADADAPAATPPLGCGAGINATQGCGGGAGTANAGGAGGAGGFGLNGSAGSFGRGGAAADGSVGGAGGGGGGLYGGGGGGAAMKGGSGGGGSSYVATGASAVSGPTVTTASPEVTISYAAPTADASAGSLGFAPQPQGSDSPQQTLTITDNGAAPLVVSGAQLDGADPGDYQLTNRCQQPVAVGGTCQIGVRFDPQAQGPSTATLTLFTNAQTSPTVSLSGTGVAPTAGPAGPQGPAGPRGPAGPAGTIVCQHTSLAKALCSLEFAPGSFTIAGTVNATFRIQKGRHTVASGTLPLHRHQTPHALLGRLAHGRYTLIIATRRAGKTRTVLRLAFTVR